jgi:predicted RNA-binding protein with PUA-like domain
MSRNRWLVKTEPSTYSWQDLAREGRTVWDGVRNALARRHLETMRQGDLVLVYHSSVGKEVVGIARVVREAYPDPKSTEWLAVDLEPVRPLAIPVSLASLKAEPGLARLGLVHQPRLSVMPVEEAHFARILALGATKAPR